MTTYKFIHFEKRQDPETKKDFYAICNKKSGDVLGFLSYYNPWKQWVFYQAVQDVVFSASCLKDIIDFMEGL